MTDQEEEQGEFIFETKLEASTVYEWVKEYHSAKSVSVEDVQHPKLKPTLRLYQEKAVRWMLSMEQNDKRTVRIVNDNDKLVHLEKGGILADEMGLGKTVEVLACLLANPNTKYKKQFEEYIEKMKADLLNYEKNIKNANKNTEMKSETIQEMSGNVETSRPKRRRKVKEIGNKEVIDEVVEENEFTNSYKSKLKTEESVYDEILNDTLFEKECKSQESGVNESMNEGNSCESNAPMNSDELKIEDGYTTSQCHVRLIAEFNPQNGAVRSRTEEGGKYKSKLDSQGQDCKIGGEKELCKEGSVDRTFEKEVETENNAILGMMKDNELMVVEGMKEGRRMEDLDGIDKDGRMNMDNEVDEKQVVKSNASGSKRTRKSAAPKRKMKNDDDDDDDDDANFMFKCPGDSTPLSSTSRRATGRIRKKAKKTLNDDDEDVDDEDYIYKSSGDSALSSSSSRRSTRQKQQSMICDDPDEDDSFLDGSDVDDPVVTAPRRSRNKPKLDSDPDFRPEPKKRKKSAKSSLLRAELQKMYEALLSETSPAVKKAKIALLKAESDYRCCCLDPTAVTDQISVKCPICHKLQHPDCVGFEPSVPYVCFTCWPQRALVPTNATLIVSPSAIAGQWSDEIKKHVLDSNLRVLVYDGVRGDGYKQPLELAKYDIVITSYQVLLKEIDYVNEDPSTRPRNMRYARKFFPPTSPLTCVEWWRICLDEAQMVECVTSKIYFMVSALHTVNRWAVCGTPIQRHVSDLFGLVAFLQVDPYGTCRKSWQQLEGNRAALAEFLPQVMWRTGKCHVLDELNVPPQKIVAHWLAFSPVETFFYRKQHELCLSLFKQKAQQLASLETAISELSGKQLTALLAPFLRLRQACLHPQLVRGGQLLASKHTLTMGELLAQMVAKASTDSEESMRQLVASLNGVAGASLLTGETLQAVNSYRRVLHLAQEYDTRLKVDTLQKIHTMYNLALLLQSGPVGVAPTLRDDTLLDDVKKLEEEYLRKRLGDLKGNKSALEALDKQLTTHGRKIASSDWWSDMLRAVDSQELLHKIQIEFEHAKGPLMAMLKKMSGLLALMEELYQWQQNIDKTRQSVIDQIKQLEDISTTVMAGHAVNCHLRKKKPPQVNKRCLICRIEHELKQYESLLFWIMNKEDSKSKAKEEQQPETSAMDETQKSSVANLENNTIFEVYNVGTWKPSQHEQILRLIYNSCNKRQMKLEWTEESQNQFNALDVLRKEFRRLRLLWSQIADQVAASDELAMAKLRLRLATTDEYLAEEAAVEGGSSSSSRRKRKPALKTNETEKRNVICPLQVDSVLEQLKAEVAVNESALKKSAGTLQYLQNLQKNGNKQTDPCPVCRNQLTDTWSVLKCGHCFCYDCTHTLSKSYIRDSITCPVCREVTSTADVSHIEGRDDVEQMAAEIKGSFTTKIHAMLAELIRLKASEPDVKVLMFSVWDRVLDVLSEALAVNEIVFCRMSSNARRRESVLKTFKTKRNVSVLLMPLRSGAKGLNLVEATHVFLAEPILNPADEQQAVGRVHRIGQSRETFVHKFAVKGTIEEKMLTAMEGGNSNWSKDKVTVKQLLDLFTPF